MKTILQIGIDPASMVDAAGIVGTLHYKPSENALDVEPPRTIIVEEIPPGRDPERALQRIVEAGAKILGLKSSIGYNRIMFVIDGTGIGNEQYARLRNKLPNLIKVNIHGNSKDGIVLKKGDRNTYSWSKHDMILTKRTASRYCKITSLGNGPALVEQISSYQEWDRDGQMFGEGRPDDLLMAWLLSMAKIPRRGAQLVPNGASVLLRGLR